jgi:NAD(P)-dependent dehydrogenase (short-subunit alcohol dehydrogenase family)
MFMNLNGKSVIVTGGGSGIGKGICKEFADHGAQIAVCDINLAAAETVAAELNAQGSRAIAVQVDVTDEAQAEHMVAETVRAFGRIDILCNNAGIIRAMGPLESLSVAEWDLNFAVNAKGVFICSKAAIPEMRKQGYGRIINTASQCGKTGTPNLGHYSAAKAAVLLFTQTLALELAKTGITVNAVCPGSVDTEMTDREVEIMARQTGEDKVAIKKKWEAGVPIGRYATPKDIARVFVFLASEYADYMTGESVNVAGGQEMH